MNRIANIADRPPTDGLKLDWIVLTAGILMLSSALFGTFLSPAPANAEQSVPVIETGVTPI